jgi:hypothetical protein
VRTRIGPLSDPHLKAGSWRALDHDEVRALARSAQSRGTTSRAAGSRAGTPRPDRPRPGTSRPRTPRSGSTRTTPGQRRDPPGGRAGPR